MGKSTISMAIFNSYPTLPEGISMILSSAETQARPSIATVRGRVLGGFGFPAPRNHGGCRDGYGTMEWGRLRLPSGKLT